MSHPNATRPQGGDKNAVLSVKAQSRRAYTPPRVRSLGRITVVTGSSGLSRRKPQG